VRLSDKLQFLIYGKRRFSRGENVASLNPFAPGSADKSLYQADGCRTNRTSVQRNLIASGYFQLFANQTTLMSDDSAPRLRRYRSPSRCTASIKRRSFFVTMPVVLYGR
jgi:hypothetical protein